MRRDLLIAIGGPLIGAGALVVTFVPAQAEETVVRLHDGPPTYIPSPPPPPIDPSMRPRSDLIYDVQWVRKASPEDLARSYPAPAWRVGIPGAVTLECVGNYQGRMQDCFVVSESPANQKFGDAALRVISRYRARPRTTDGHPIEGARVRIVVTFDKSALESVCPDQCPVG